MSSTQVLDLNAEIASEVQKKEYTHIIVRASYFKSADSSEFLYGRVDYSNNPKRPGDQHESSGIFRMVRKVFDISESQRIVDELVLGNFVIEREKIPINKDSDKILSYFIPSGRTWAHFDFNHAVRIIEIRSRGSVPHFELAARNGPTYFANVKDAITYFMGLSGEVYGTGVHIILPETRGTISKLTITGHELNVQTQMTKADPDYVVKFSCRNQTNHEHVGKNVNLYRGTANFECPFEPEGASVALVHIPSDEMVDSKEFRGLYSDQRGIEVKTPQSFVSEMINGGESETVEFKVGIQEKDEIVDTIASFANKRGGWIIIGIRNDQKVLGFRDDEEKTKKTIQGLVKSFIEPFIETKLQWTDIDGKPLLLIRVEEGKEKPYVIRTRGILVRSGDGDYQISRAELDAIYDSKPSRNVARIG